MKANWTKRAGVLLFMLLLALGLAGPASADDPICYVDADATGLNNGNGWTDAYTDLQDALVQSGPACGVIWVAEGTYKPTSGPNRAVSFVVQADVQLYGGFVGTESLLSERSANPQVNHPTILSGDIGIASEYSDNSYHVVKTLGSEVLDGFVVSGGNASAVDPDNSGGGLYSICTIDHQTLVLTNMIIKNNRADDDDGGAGYGAGVYANLCKLGFTNSLFEGNTMWDSNTTSYGSGGGLALVSTSTLMSTITSVTFHNNSAGSGYGGGIYSTAPLTLTDVTIDHNSAGASNNANSKVTGGGIFTNDTLNLTSVVFSFNSGKQGGGLYTSATIANLNTVTFNDNSARDKGGGMFGKSPTLVDVQFTNNSAYTPAAPPSPAYGSGGGIYINVGTPQLTRVTFTGNDAYMGGGLYGFTMHGSLADVIFDANTAGFYGGGAVLDNGSNPAIARTTFMNNLAATRGGGLYDYSSIPALTNVTFYNNKADQGGGMANDDNSNASLNYVTIYANIATIGGGGMANFTGTKYSDSGPSNPNIKNSIFWGNIKNDGFTITPDQVYNDSDGSGSSRAAITYSVVEGGYLGTGVLTGDPHLGTFDNYYGSFTKTFPILAGSSAINVGEPLTCGSVDQNSILRPIGSNCDMGAYEAGYRISGSAGTPDVTISYYDGTAKTATSDASGNYFFSVSYGYTGIITPYKTGSAFLPPMYDYASSPVNADLPNQDFIPYTAVTYTISGTLGTTGKSGLVTYTPGGTTTANSTTGAYSFQVNQGWSGTVTPTKTGYTFAPLSITYSNVNQNLTNQNYVATDNTKATLTVNKVGSGTVTSSPGGISCGSTCSYAFTKPLSVTLTATATTAGYIFAGWSGEGCSGTGTCVVTMDVAKSVTATFANPSSAHKVYLPLVRR